MQIQPTPIRVVVVDDHPLTRDGIRQQLERASAIVTIVGEGGAGEQVEPLVEKMRPDVLLLDLTMPWHEGEKLWQAKELFEPVAAIERLQQQFPGTRILVVSQDLRQAVIERLANAGAAGYLLKDDALSANLVTAVRTVHNGGVCFSPDVTQYLMERRRGLGPEEVLSERQREILTFAILHANSDNAEIAEELSIAPTTYKWHLQNIREILGVRTHAAALLKGVQMGLASADALHF